MFILRRITPQEPLEINTSIGDNYVVISRELNNTEFMKTVQQWQESDLEGIYALVVYDNGQHIMPLYEGSIYYIMTHDGKTFSNITQRK